ncbi:MAG: DUF1320 domain-containing protein [Candidatus Riflebacteria bacterium]|nr:DUF1320 domain-containing protein [Candidatus Riflebacteria bacterium]
MNMAAYCTVSDLIDRMPEEDIIALSNDDETPTINNSRVTAAISDASEFIDGFLRGVYDLPLATVPVIIKGLCISLVIYKLYLRRFAGDSEGIPETVAENNKMARADLISIQRGIIKLDTGNANTDQGMFLTDKNGMEEFADSILNKF